MKNFVQSPQHIDFTVPAGGVVSGAGVLIGHLFGVAAASAAEGETAVMCTEGVFTLPKLNTAVLAAGDKVSWDAGNHRCDAPGAGLYPIGVAVAGAGNGSSTVKVRLDGISTSAAA